MPPCEPPPLDLGACDAPPCEPLPPRDWLGAAGRAEWLCDGAGLERVVGREVFCRKAGFDGWRAELDDCELNRRESGDREPVERESNWRGSNERELGERVLFCCTRVELFGERETAFSRCVVRACVEPFEPRAALVVLGRAKLEPRLKLFDAVAPRLGNSPGRAVAAVAGWP